MSKDAQQLADAIDNKDIMIRLVASENEITDKGAVLVGGHFGGSDVVKEDVEVKNPWFAGGNPLIRRGGQKCKRFKKSIR
ncbi:MAG: hypothetical protein EOP48_13290 [Sphingobacteriales bacterium]|nr:MAG: hypothetical protein EOP48_13290 [Sphingobacteriales bacterium]